MKEIKRTLSITRQSVIHYTFFITLLILIIILPVLYTQTGSPPYWAICIIFGLLLLFYILYLVRIFFYRHVYIFNVLTSFF